MKKQFPFLSKAITVVIATFVLTLSGCSSNPSKALVTEYLASKAGIDAKSVKIVEISEPETWTGADSLELLQKEFDSLKAEKIVHLQAAIDASTAAIESAEKVKQGGFSALKDLADETITQSKEQIEMATALMAALKSDCKGTTLENLYNRVQDFEGRKEEILYKSISGKWATKEDKEAKAFHLLADKELKSIIGSAAE